MIAWLYFGFMPQKDDCERTGTCEAAPAHRMYTSEEGDEYIRAGRGYLKQQRWLGKGPPYYKLGGRMVRYDVRDLDAHLAARRVEPGVTV